MMCLKSGQREAQREKASADGGHYMPLHMEVKSFYFALRAAPVFRAIMTVSEGLKKFPH
jgi:hypothetical protein